MVAKNFVEKFLNANIYVNYNAISMRRLKKILQVTMIINAYLNAIDQDLAAINVLENAFNAKAGNVILTTMYVIIW